MSIGIRKIQWTYKGTERKAWQVDLGAHPVTGKRVRKTVPDDVAKWPDNKKAAKAWGEEQLATLQAEAAGTPAPASVTTAKEEPLPVKDKPGIPVTLNEAIPRYLAASDLHDSANTRELKGLATRHIAKWNGDARLDSIGPGSFDDFATYLKGLGTLKVSSIGTYQKKLHGLLAYAVNEGWLSRAPKYKKLKDRTVSEDGDTDKEISDADWLNFDETDKLLAEAKGGVWHVLYMTAIQTGLRPSELCGLRRKSVVLDKSARYRFGFLNVIEQFNKGAHKPPKWNKTRKVPLTEAAHDALKEWLKKTDGGPEDPVFPDGGALSGWMSRDVYANHLAADCEKAGIKVVTPHKLRHTFASQRTILRMSPNALMLIMGHASLAETQKYQHLAASDVDDALADTEAADKARRAKKAAA
jgi:integrase